MLFYCTVSDEGLRICFKINQSGLLMKGENDGKVTGSKKSYEKILCG